MCTPRKRLIFPIIAFIFLAHSLMPSWAEFQCFGHFGYAMSSFSFPSSCCMSSSWDTGSFEVRRLHPPESLPNPCHSPIPDSSSVTGERGRQCLVTGHQSGRCPASSFLGGWIYVCVHPQVIAMVGSFDFCQILPYWGSAQAEVAGFSLSSRQLS